MGRPIDGGTQIEKDKNVPVTWAVLMKEALGRVESAQLELKSAKDDVRRLQKDRARWTI